jgi:hypothetical protein
MTFKFPLRREPDFGLAVLSLPLGSLDVRHGAGESFVGVFDRSQHVDHVDGNGLDCRKKNIRLCSRGENSMNRRKQSGSSSFKGVTLVRNGKWKAQIQANGQKISLGTFGNEEDAASAYDNAARGMHGAFARVNFKEGIL